MIWARRRALPGDAASKLGLALVGETMFPPRSPFFQRPFLLGEPPGSPGTPPHLTGQELAREGRVLQPDAALALGDRRLLGAARARSRRAHGRRRLAARPA